ncbi:RagB/SusD family nutrient uptake outer membrane protein [Sphingobacterium spiritivorum]|nr:RagB/SusD family nutrient uptake outer membrane protein [Sphingobacterium spiritivorum]QQS95712.1 RagB/SusD family nutrient uptake outer membrane protein [Sphingobacterium spiritivorum]
MKNNLYFTLCCIACLLSMISCKKFLDVYPEDRFLQKQVFDNENAVNSALNGIYLNMAKSTLYGSQLSMLDLDIMAQYYNSNLNTGILASYNYTSTTTLSSFSSIWQSAYRTILNANSFIEQIRQTEGVIDNNRKDIVLGEAYAIRAYLHFDMLRLFGPVYTTDSLQLSIPYMTIPTDQIQSLLPANAVMDSVIRDLDRALVLLKNDPVRKEGVTELQNTDAISNFYRMRNRRFNYYAVMGVKARVLLYRKDYKGALSTAKAVIGEAGKYFPWSPATSSMPGATNPDRSFSSEIILGFQNANMYNQHRDFFNVSLYDNRIIAPIPQRLDEIYEKLVNDYRYRVDWRDGGSAGKTYKTFIKYEDINQQNVSFRGFQSLLRLSELYYIAAECETDPAQAIVFLNTVRINRGLPDLKAGANVTAELFKEYRKEFWGEGQTFFYFKRRALTGIPSGSADGFTIKMNAVKYVVPLPLAEIQNR